jgi:hypothetical protein
MKKAQDPDEVQVDQAGGSDLFESARIALRRRFETLGDHAPRFAEQRSELGIPVATTT